jgi:hypothetical protein
VKIDPDVETWALALRYQLAYAVGRLLGALRLGRLRDFLLYDLLRLPPPRPL